MPAAPRRVRNSSGRMSGTKEATNAGSRGSWLAGDNGGRNSNKASEVIHGQLTQKIKVSRENLGSAGQSQSGSKILQATRNCDSDD